MKDHRININVLYSIKVRFHLCTLVEKKKSGRPRKGNGVFAFVNLCSMILKKKCRETLFFHFFNV